MPLENKKRSKLSDSQLKSEIISLFNQGNTAKTELFGLIRIKHTLARDRYFRMYDICLSEWSKIKDNATTEATVSAATKAAKRGLKSVFGKKQHLQQQIDEIQNELDKGTYLDSVVVGGNVTDIERRLSPEMKTTMRRVMKDLYVELNKMDGDYAPKKIATTDVAGNDIEQPFTAEMIEKILKATQ